MMNNNGLIISCSLVGASLIVCFTLLTLYYPGDKGIVYGALLSLTTAIFAQLKSLQVSTQNGQKLDENTQLTKDTYTKVNGQTEAYIGAIQDKADAQIALAKAQAKVGDHQ